MAEARSNVIAQMHADDIAMPERLARQLDFLNAHPQVVVVVVVVVVGCRILAIDSDGDPIAEFCTVQTHEEIVSQSAGQVIIVTNRYPTFVGSYI